MAQPFEPTTDLQLTDASSDARHAAHVGQEKNFGNGIVATMMLANGAVAEGALVGMTGTAGDAEALTSTILTALSASDREALEIGFCQAAGGAADNEYFWAVKRKPSGADTGALALSGAAITAGNQVTTSAVAGEVITTATGNYEIVGLSITTDPASGTTFSTWDARDALRLNPTITP